MNSRTEEQKTTEAQSKAKKPRFKIEKLEERIAPRGCARRHCGSPPYGRGIGGGRF